MWHQHCGPRVDSTKHSWGNRHLPRESQGWKDNTYGRCTNLSIVGKHTKAPIGFMVCHNVLYDDEVEAELLLDSWKLEHSRIEVNAKQALFGFQQNIKFHSGQVLDLECDKESFWLSNQLPTREERREWLAKIDKVYIIIAKGSHINSYKSMHMDTVLKANHIVWTGDKLEHWQKHFCFHSTTLHNSHKEDI